MQSETSSYGFISSGVVPGPSDLPADELLRALCCVGMYWIEVERMTGRFALAMSPLPKWV